jgi:hypothetical protein
MYDRPMAGPRSLALVIAFAVAACSGASPPTPSASTPLPATASTAEATPSAEAAPTAVSTPSPPPATPAARVDLALALRIAPPYELEQPSASDFDQLSGNIQGLPADLAAAAGAGYAPTDFPIGFRFIGQAGASVAVLVVLAMPGEVAELPGLLTSIAPAVAAEVNAVLSYDTIGGVEVGLLRGPIACALAIVDGHLVMVQSGQPAVRPADLMTAVIAAN